MLGYKLLEMICFLCPCLFGVYMLLNQSILLLREISNERKPFHTWSNVCWSCILNLKMQNNTKQTIEKQDTHPKENFKAFLVLHTYLIKWIWELHS